MKGQKKLWLGVGWARCVARAGATEVTGYLDLEEEPRGGAGQGRGNTLGQPSISEGACLRIPC